MRYVFAILMGGISGFLIYLAAAYSMFSSGSMPGWFIPLAFIGGWVFSTWLMLRNTLTASRVASRGFLIGTTEWLLLIVAAFIGSGRAVSQVVNNSHGEYASASTAGAVISGGLSIMIITAVSLTFAIVCLIGFFISKSMGSELKPELATATKRCPECAEYVQEQARKCRHCGASIQAEALVPT